MIISTEDFTEASHHTHKQTCGLLATRDNTICSNFTPVQGLCKKHSL